VPAGVYRWTSHQSIKAIRHIVEHARWRCLILDTWSTEDKTGFFEACARCFGFPDSFAHNFDALDDCLSDIHADPDQEGLLVLWDGWGPFARADRVAFDVAVDVFGSRVDFRQAPQGHGGQFAVVLHGPGPDDVEVASLDSASSHR
jgi:hypothetical protein